MPVVYPANRGEQRTWCRPPNEFLPIQRRVWWIGAILGIVGIVVFCASLIVVAVAQALPTARFDSAVYGKAVISAGFGGVAMMAGAVSLGLSRVLTPGRGIRGVLLVAGISVGVLFLAVLVWWLAVFIAWGLGFIILNSH